MKKNFSDVVKLQQKRFSLSNQIFHLWKLFSFSSPTPKDNITFPLMCTYTHLGSLWILKALSLRVTPKWQNIICLDSHQSKLRILSHCKVPLRMTESYSLFFHVKPFSVTGYNSIIRNLVRMRITSFDDMLRSPFIESAKSSISKFLNASQGQNNQFRVWWFCLVRRQSGIVLFLNSNL